MNRIENIKNLDKIKYLLSKGSNYFLDRYNTMEEEKGENIYTRETHINCLLKYLSKAEKQKGVIKTSYKYSTKMKDCGRIYVKVFGIQSLKRDVRGFLCSDNYIDYDMINAHPTILLYIAKKYFKDSPHSYLEKYVENRKEILLKYNFTKKDFLVEMNRSKKYDNKNNKFLYNVNIEIKKLQDLIFNSTIEPFITVSKGLLKINNKKGGFMNRVICCFEKTILDLVSTSSNDINFFDGFLSPSNFDCNDLNDKTKEYGIKWCIKKHDNSIQKEFDKEFDSTLPEYETPYESMKKEFEKNHFMTESPLQYYTFYNNCLNTYCKNDFCDIVAPYQLEEENKQTPFFNHWLKDSQRRIYNKVDFIPDLNSCPENVFNLFKGFKANYIEEKDRVDTSLYFDLLKLVTGNDQSAFDYVRQYNADMFQNPSKRPEVMIVFRGDKGTGKDLSFSFLREIIGNDYCHDTAEIDEVIGKNNKIGASQKLLCMINELNGSTGFANDSKLKQFMTEQSHTICEKYEKPRTEANYQRIYINFNGLNAINVTSDNRRIMLCKTGTKKPKKWYENLALCLKDKDFINTLYSQYMDMDLSNFNIREFPETEALSMAKENNVNAIYKYLHHIIIKDEIKNILNFDNKIFKDKSKDIYYFSTTAFIFKFKKYLNNTGEYGDDYINKYNYKSLVMILADIGIKKKQKKIMGSVFQAYVIDKEACREKIKVKYNPIEDDIDTVDIEDINIEDIDSDQD